MSVGEPLQIISLGVGIQSSMMALKAAAGEITPMPDAAIFADTGAEPQRVYDFLDWLEPRLPFPVYRVMFKDGLLENLHASLKGGRFAGAPFYTESAGRREGMLRRQCTREFKIQPIHRQMRQMAGLNKGQRAPKGKLLVVSWQGISTDEIQRARASVDSWLELRYPLLELRVSRLECAQYLAEQLPVEAPPVGKSSCTFCPYHDDAMWRDMKAADRQAWQQAVEIDALIRGGVRGTKQRLYLHRSCQPLEEVDLRNAKDYGQTDMFADECEGMCGL